MRQRPPRYTTAKRWLVAALILMQVRVLFFGVLKDLTGRANDLLKLPEHATLADVVVHYEGLSHGRNVDVGLKSCQAVNRRKFVATWADELARNHYANGAHVLRAREHARHDVRVLAKAL